MRYSIFCLVIGLSGCATAGSDLLPRVVAGAEAAKDIFAAVCHPVPKGAEKLCADLQVAVSKYDEVSGDVLKVASEVLKPQDADAGVPAQN